MFELSEIFTIKRGCSMKDKDEINHVYKHILHPQYLPMFGLRVPWKLWFSMCKHQKFWFRPPNLRPKFPVLSPFRRARMVLLSRVGQKFGEIFPGMLAERSDFEGAYKSPYSQEECCNFHLSAPLHYLDMSLQPTNHHALLGFDDEHLDLHLHQ
jgi:hypothetical protein